MSVILKAENISKQYRLGVVGTGTLSHDLNRWWHTVRGKEDPYLKIGESNDRSSKGNSDYVWALRDINFEVQKGEVLGIIGKNGAGKSTLLKILSRVTTPTTGSIKTAGRIASLLEVGTGFHPELTGRENIYLNGTILGMTKAEVASKLDEIIAFSGCERYVDTPVKRYSSGMKVRLAFAVAAHLEPEILVVDEVLAVGDAEFQKKAIGKMQDISKGEGRTVLFVSHNMAAVKSLCTRGVVIENGRLIYEGTQDEAVDYYIKKQDVNTTFNRTNEKIKNPSVKIQSIITLNENNTPVSILLAGDEVRFKILVEVTGYNDYADLSIGIGVYSNDDLPQIHCSTEELNTTYSAKGELIEATLIIKKWPLVEGEYSINAFVRDKNLLLDHLKECLWIKVEKGDFYGSGKLPSWNKGFYVDYEWK